MIINNLNSRETKILNSIQIAFNDFSEKLESVDFFVDMKTEFFRVVWYVFKKDGSYDVVIMNRNDHYPEIYFEKYQKLFDDDSIDFSVKFCDKILVKISEVQGLYDIACNGYVPKTVTEKVKEIFTKVLLNFNDEGGKAVFCNNHIDNFFSFGNRVVIFDKSYKESE
jgi:hypothetical protein